MNHSRETLKEVRKPSLTIFFKKRITSANSKSSNYSAFSAILQKLYDMTCEIIVSNTVYGILLIFCRSSFINNFMAKNNFLEPYNHQNLNISRPIYFKKNTARRFEDHIYTNQPEEFFFEKIFFSRTWSFFHDSKTTDLASFFSRKD